MKSESKPKAGRSATGGGRMVRDLFILLAMTLVAFAVGLGLLMQFGQGLAMSAGVALLAYVAMLGAHTVVRSGEREAELRGQLATQAQEIARLRLQMSEGFPELPQAATEPRVEQLPPGTDAIHEPNSDLRVFEGPLVAESPPAGRYVGEEPPPASLPPDRSLDRDVAATPAGAIRPSPEAPSEERAQPPPHSVAAVVAAALDARTDDAVGRPLALAEPLQPLPRPAPDEFALVEAAAPVAADVPVRHPPKSDVEMIEGLIRKLADDLAVPPPQAADLQDETPANGPHAGSGEPVETQLARSIAALQQAAGGMRQIDGLASAPPAEAPRGEVVSAAHAFAVHAHQVPLPSATATELPDAVEVPASDPPERPGADVIAEAVERERIELFLEPILSLSDRKSRHFEVSVRLRAADGAILDPQECRDAAAGTGVLPRLDAAKLARTARIIRRLEERGKLSSVFSNLSGESLGDELFLGDFVDLVAARRSITGYLVLGFTQGDVRAFTDQHWDTLAKLSRLGFRFALEEVGDLDMDLAELKLRGFAYVRLDATVLLAGMPAADGLFVSAADIARHLVEMGLTVIAGRIAAESDLARMTDLGIALGQGPLFGGPHPVKAEILSQPLAAGAPAAA